MRFVACYTSPKVRARDTARLACRPLSMDPEEVRALAAGFDRDRALDLLAGHDDDARVLVVGHNPDFPQVVHDFTGARVVFKKGGLAAVQVDGSVAELLALMRPLELQSLAGG